MRSYHSGLSTGVDARNIRNIVLMRPINSMIEFKQIIGRGTRLYDGKDYFTIYDFVKAIFTSTTPNGTASRWSRSPERSAAISRADAQMRLRPRNHVPFAGRHLANVRKTYARSAAKAPAYARKRQK